MRDFRAFISMTCPGLTPGQFTTQIGTAALKKVKIAPAARPSPPRRRRPGPTIRVSGKLKGRQVTGGRAELSIGTCSGTPIYKTKR